MILMMMKILRQETGKAIAPKRKVTQRLVSLIDDSYISSNVEKSYNSNQKQKIISKKNAVDKDEKGYRVDANNCGDNGIHKYSQKEEEFASNVAKNDKTMGRTLNETDRSKRLQKSKNEKEMMKGKTKFDDE